jgi:hypothetical protein
MDTTKNLLPCGRNIGELWQKSQGLGKGSDILSAISQTRQMAGLGFTEPQVAFGDRDEFFAEHPVFFDSESNRYFIERNGQWESRTERHLVLRAAVRWEFSRLRPEGSLYSPMEKLLDDIAEQRSVDGVFEYLAGYPAGAHIMLGNRVLVRKGFPLIESKRGECPTIQSFLRHLLGEEERQYDRLLVWLAGLVRDLHDLHSRRKGIDDVIRIGMALFLLGPSGVGKTFLLDQIITPICGGRTANPFSFMSDPNERFNGDLFGAPLLLCDDPRGKSSYEDRRIHGQKLKELLSGGNDRCNRKGRDAISLRVYRRIIYLMNADEDGFRAFPALTDGVTERILALRTGEEKWDGFRKIPREELRRRIVEELPAFTHHLLMEYVPPTKLCDERFACAPFIHPTIEQLAWEATPEAQLAKLIFPHFENQDRWEGSPTELYSMMNGSPEHRLEFRNHAKNPDMLGRKLSVLCKKSPAHFSKSRTNRGMIYTITPPKTSSYE